MKVLFTKHLKFRLKQRRIPTKIAREIIKTAQEYYWDALRKHHIMVAEVQYKNKLRKVLLSYDKIAGGVELITLHPIASQQIQNRLNSGRWGYEKTDS